MPTTKGIQVGPFSARNRERTVSSNMKIQNLSIVLGEALKKGVGGVDQSLASH
ncbi:MAG: hypothetical protein ACLP5V_10060 [Candidatus Bathyarchaeia archaeon]